METYLFIDESELEKVRGKPIMFPDRNKEEI